MPKVLFIVTRFFAFLFCFFFIEANNKYEKNKSLKKYHILFIKMSWLPNSNVDVYKKQEQEVKQNLLTRLWKTKEAKSTKREAKLINYFNSFITRLSKIVHSPA